mgnify:CR=1 FL=1
MLQDFSDKDCLAWAVLQLQLEQQAALDGGRGTIVCWELNSAEGHIEHLAGLLLLPDELRTVEHIGIQALKEIGEAAVVLRLDVHQMWEDLSHYRSDGATFLDQGLDTEDEVVIEVDGVRLRDEAEERLHRLLEDSGHLGAAEVLTLDNEADEVDRKSEPLLRRLAGLAAAEPRLWRFLLNQRILFRQVKCLACGPELRHFLCLEGLLGKHTLDQGSDECSRVVESEVGASRSDEVLQEIEQCELSLSGELGVLHGLREIGNELVKIRVHLVAEHGLANLMLDGIEALKADDGRCTRVGDLVKEPADHVVAELVIVFRFASLRREERLIAPTDEQCQPLLVDRRPEPVCTLVTSLADDLEVCDQGHDLRNGCVKDHLQRQLMFDRTV